MLTDISCHRETDIRVDVDLANGHLGCLTELFLRNTDRVRHVAAVLVDHLYELLRYG